MLMNLYIGMIMGAVYFVAKLGLFTLVTTKGMRRWINKHTLVQAGLDTVWGVLGMKVFSMAEGSISMIAMITFTACCMLYIFTHIGINKAEVIWNEYSPKLGL